MEIIIKDGCVYDGSGRAPFYKDIRIRDGYIQEIGDHLSGGDRVFSADGCIVAPGFIDEHTHTDRTIFDFPYSNSKIMQGVTSEVTCNCGIGPFPAPSDRKKEILDYMSLSLRVPSSYSIQWEDFAGFAEAVQSVHPAANLLPLAAHGALRIAVMGMEDRPASPDEQKQMEALLAFTLDQGAWGMSAGLIYPPGSFADTEELEGLGRVLADFGSIFTCHVRGEGRTLLKADREMLNIGKKSGCDILISHLKAVGRPYWGDGQKALEMILEARKKGQTVWADQYPYEASSTALSILLPDWAHDGGNECMLRRMADPALRRKMLISVRSKLRERGGPSCIQIADAEHHKEWMGQTLQDIADHQHMKPEEAVLHVLQEESGVVSVILYVMGREDVEAILKERTVAVCSDGYGIAPSDHGYRIHPRSYGTFARVLGHYVRDQKLLSMEDAIWKMTGLPASVFHIPRRGFIREGFRADITVFDPGTICDKATFDNPHQYAEGIEMVFVGGVLSLYHGKLTGERNGAVLKRGKLS